MRTSVLRASGFALALTSSLLVGCGGGGGGATPNGIAVVPPCYGGACMPTAGGSSSPASGASSAPTSGGTTAPTGSASSGASSAPTGGATAAPTGGATSGATSSPSGSPTSGASSAATPGTLSLSPTVLVPVGVTNPATAQTTATQSNYGGSFSPSISCPVALPAGALTATADGDVITVSENPSEIPDLGANVFCTLTVTGGGGMTATAQILLAATVLPSASATPTATPAPGATPGAVTVAPNLLVPIGVTNPATATATISQYDYSGPWTSAVTCPVALPTGAVTSSVSGDVLTITENDTLLPSTAGASILCTVTVTGGAQMTGSANVLLGANAGS